MRDSIKGGFGFGLTSGIITTLGLLIGLYASTNSRAAIIGGIITIAVADAASDALGIHISEESKNDSDNKHVWESTFVTFISKFVFALSFLVPLWLLCIEDAIFVSIVWGFSLLILFSYYVSKIQNERPLMVILEHVVIALSVVILTYYLGIFVNTHIL